MRQATKKQQKTKRFTAKQIVLTSIAAVVAIVLAFIAYQKYLDYADKRRFSELKADMLSLQTEFNKIEPGWEYSEGCTAGGTVFDDDAYKGCSIELQNVKSNFDNYSGNTLNDTFSKYAVESGYFTGAEDTKKYKDNGVSHRVTTLTRKNFPDVRCNIDSTSYSIGLTCRSDARNFYFERID